MTPPTPLPSTTHLTSILTLLAGHLFASFLPLYHSLISFHSTHSIAPPPPSFSGKDHQKTPQEKGKAHSSLKEFILVREDSPKVISLNFTKNLQYISLFITPKPNGN